MRRVGICLLWVVLLPVLTGCITITTTALVHAGVIPEEHVDTAKVYAAKAARRAAEATQDAAMNVGATAQDAAESTANTFRAFGG